MTGVLRSEVFLVGVLFTGEYSASLVCRIVEGFVALVALLVLSVLVLVSPLSS